MTDLKMHTGSSEVISRFIKDLKLGQKLLVSAFTDTLRQVNEAQDIKVLQTLLKQRILVTSANGYRLNPHLQKLFNSVIDVDRSRYINVNIKARIPSLELVMNAYIANLQEHNPEYARESLADIEQQAFEIVFEAQGAVKSLANRLQTRFGFVRSLREKILENESAITTAGLLVENLTAFTFDRMSEYVHRADNDPKLYNIVCVHMLGELAKTQASLNSIMIQLREMLALFRRERKRTNLLKSFSEKHYKEPGYHVGDFPISGKMINELFKCATSFTLGGHADFRSDSNLSELCRIVESLKKSTSCMPEASNIEKSLGFDMLPKVQTEAFNPDETEDDIIAFFRAVIDAPNALSAKEYYTTHDINGELDHWLFAVCAFYEDLSPENKAGFLAPKISYGYMYDMSDLDDAPLFKQDNGNIEHNFKIDTTALDINKSILIESNKVDTVPQDSCRIKYTGFGNKILTDIELQVRLSSN